MVRDHQCAGSSGEGGGGAAVALNFEPGSLLERHGV
jgi:hypothetical protein